jgi:hypothetical protein|nr:MAG TPA: hypothetical protein [Caudoviricetes sp.]
MNKKFTNEEVVKAAHCCTKNDCKTCPFIVLGAGFKNCVIKFSEYIANNTKNEPAPAATGTSSEVSKDTDNIHIDDSTLLNICQEELEAISEIALDDYPNEYLTGYIVALKKNIERLRGEQSD